MPKVNKSEATAAKTSSDLPPQSDIVEAAATVPANLNPDEAHLSSDIGRCTEPNCPYSDVEDLVWIQCDACHKWYHCVCISGYNVNIAPNWKYFFCSCYRPEGCP
ncbi:hypothetical protein AAVH_34325 [Aphelenchoides avenae]|nr:hypothetical protein AAVH_34325 [Aphelenchus avenae]